MTEIPENTISTRAARTEKRDRVPSAPPVVIATPLYSAVNQLKSNHKKAALDGIIGLLENPEIQAALNTARPKHGMDHYTFAATTDDPHQQTIKQLLTEYRDNWARVASANARVHEDILQILGYVGRQNLDETKKPEEDPFRELMNLAQLALGHIQSTSSTPFKRPTR